VSGTDLITAGLDEIDALGVDDEAPPQSSSRACRKAVSSHAQSRRELRLMNVE